MALLLALLGALAVLGVGVAPAGAHASLVAVDPPDGARLDESPKEIRLTFSEGVSVRLGGVRVLDAEGNRVDVGAAEGNGSVVTVQVRPDLPDGTYVVAYRIVSEDGHPVRGGSVFGVGDGTVDAGALGRVADPDADRTWEVVGGLFRALAYAGVLVAAGGIAFLVLVHDGGDGRRGQIRLVRTAGLLGGLAAVMALPTQAALGTGEGPRSLLDDGVLGEVAKDGVGLAVGLAVAGLAVALLGLGRSRWVALAGAALAAGSFAASGHTRAGNAAGATAADATHLLVAAAWGGGLVLLWRTLRHHRRGGTEPSVTAGVVLRFSDLATVSILAVGVSGLVLSWNEVRSIHNLGTNYGRLLMAKLAVVALVAAAGAYNRFRLAPALRSGKLTAGLAHLRRTVRAEVIGLAVVVALTTVLVVATPARTAVSGGPVEKIVAMGDLGDIQVVVAPARVGFNEMHLYLFDPAGRPANLADTVSVELSLPSADLGPIVRDATRAGPAHLQFNGNDFAVAGDWSITLRVRVDRFTEVSGTTELTIGR